MFEVNGESLPALLWRKRVVELTGLSVRNLRDAVESGSLEVVYPYKAKKDKGRMMFRTVSVLRFCGLLPTSVGATAPLRGAGRARQ